jgi:hypothetical protein
VVEWQRAIEIGPGSGKYTVKVLEASQSIVRAYDVSPQFLKVCEARCHEWINRSRLSLQLLGTRRPDQMLCDIEAFGWRRQVDAVFSIDAMVHVDLQYLIVYLITAALTLRPGGKLILTLADATRDLGFAKLLGDIAWAFPNQANARGSGKFEWLGPDIVRSVLTRLGFEPDVVIESRYRDLGVVASLRHPELAEALERYVAPPAATAG